MRGKRVLGLLVLTFLELPAGDVALGHGGRHGRHGEVLGSTAGDAGTEGCLLWLACLVLVLVLVGTWRGLR